MSLAEYRRKFRVLDQMLSGHASLRERYRRRSLGLTLAIMALSILAASLALSAERPVEIVAVTFETKQWLAILAGVVFFFSIVELVVDWRGRAWAHGDAARRLGLLKGQFRRVEMIGNTVDSKGVDLDEAYDETTAAIVEIPNSSFNRLKARHRRKLAVSDLQDTSPGAPVLYLRWLVFRSGVASARTQVKTLSVLEESPPGAEGGASIDPGSTSPGSP